jgi:hypothetical protein
MPGDVDPSSATPVPLDATRSSDGAGCCAPPTAVVKPVPGRCDPFYDSGEIRRVIAKLQAAQADDEEQRVSA